MSPYGWVSNDVGVPTYTNVARAPGESMREAFDRHVAWRSQFFEGPCRHPDGSLAPELDRIGMIGLYTESPPLSYSTADIKLLRDAIPPMPLDEDRIRRTVDEAEARRARHEDS